MLNELMKPYMNFMDKQIEFNEAITESSRLNSEYIIQLGERINLQNEVIKELIEIIEELESKLEERS